MLDAAPSGMIEDSSSQLVIQAFKVAFDWLQ
jgi:hypothetical protein